MKKQIRNYVINKKLFLISLLILFISGVEIITAQYRMNVINSVVDGSGRAVVLTVLAIYLTINIVDILSKYVYKLIKINFVEKTKNNIMKDISSDVFQQNIKQFNDVGKYLSWFTNDIELIDQRYLETIFSLISEIFYVVIAIVFIANMNLIILALILISSVVFALLVNKLSPSIQAKSLALSQCNEKYFSRVKNLVMGLHIILFNNKEDYLFEKFEGESLNLKDYSISQEKSLLSAYLILNLIAVVFQIGIFLVNGYFVYLDLMTVGSLIFVANIAGRLMNSTYLIAMSFVSIKSAQEVYNKVYNAIDRDNQFEQNDLVDIDTIDSIKFENLSVSYDDKKVLDGFNLAIEKGKKYAIVGESGSGKTTLINTILGLVDEYNGNVLINNTNIKKINKASMFENIGFVNSDNFVFYKDIQSNVVSLSEKVTNEDKERVSVIMNDLKLDNIDKQKELSENKISTGQKQRINLAKLFFEQKNLIILDEATANLDAENRTIVENKLLANDKLTVIMITHHLQQSLANKLDYIIDLDRGQNDNFK